MERSASRRVVCLVSVLAVLLLQLLGVAEAAAAANCSTHCGNITIPYPFGVEPGCYRDGFNLTCDHSHQLPKLFLGDGTVEVLDISIPSGTVRISSSSIVPTSVASGPGKINQTCRCSSGYQGNPYIPNGCQDIDECAQWDLHSCYGTCINKPGTFHCQCPDGTYGLSIGLVVSGGSVILLLAFGAPYVTRKIKLRQMKKLKEKFFKENHGLLFQQLISQKVDIGERMIITLADLEKATNNFDKAREIGGGGHGVVYKGILDLNVVAIKKSKIIVQREIDEFINEVAILSQINHRNVVKLLGCCLETEVPLLVYEFISNGTLYHHLHVEGPISIPWGDRLRIALEVARAVAYLHSASSMPVFHRDIKSSNILLDDSLTAKVSDFGASRYIPIDQTGVTTAVQGTFGYLDPMYYYTGRLTDKSDVFSFGVLLVELLTRKKPSVYTTDNGGALVLHFVSLLTEGDLIPIVDPQVMEEGDGEFQEVATLAAMCVKLKGDDRPTMREVEMALENLQVKKKHAALSTTSKRYNGDQSDAQYMLFGGFTDFQLLAAPAKAASIMRKRAPAMNCTPSVLLFGGAVSAAAAEGGGTVSCGNISIPFFLGEGTVQVLEISIPDGETISANSGRMVSDDEVPA
ncbi:hypothetical protein GUJ93_ZPchr0008g12087 [Zizania palustris]|uniref:Protein kinase domain-containing protein n=1 Tax=Zizania palustris TaxID=103762 RepID=A0A8J5RXF1_ZIZPA|nr:hypothetical protein GUJ93_ZPchr0008g12087 [Zizania palustris]